MHQKKQRYTYLKAGNTQPVFLCSAAIKSRVYIDVEQGDITLLYSMDSAEMIKKNPSYVEWLVYEGGVISEDFATELFGPPTAVRMHIKNTGRKDVQLKIIQQ